MSEVGPLVLIADDDEDTLSQLQRALERRGFRVECVTDGQALVDRAQFEPRPDVVVTDLDMPRLSGLDALPSLAQQGIPTIVVSALHPKLNYDLILRRGAAAVLQKPLRPRLLVSELMRLVDLSATG
ncbi:MAG: response regulator [Myxococcales bacterium]|nr:response regulator [Myxococcales bacterium]